MSFDGKPLMNWVIAAPVEMEGKRHIMFVRLRQNEADPNAAKRFYVHEIILEKWVENEETSPFKTGSDPEVFRGKKSGGNGFYLSLARRALTVNPETVSKVVDKNGEPLVVYHGSKEAGFDIFDPGMADRRLRPNSVFFSDSRRTARTYSGSLNDVNFAKDEDGEPIPHRAIYAVLLIIRNPYEAHFEGANWDGTRTGQFVVMDAEGEQLYSDSGRGYFADEEDAQALADMHDGAEVVPAEDGFETTNSVAMEASQYGLDGAIIFEVIDDGGEAETYDTSNVFVVFDANQVKSADANNGKFSSDPSILFSSAPQSKSDQSINEDLKNMRKRWEANGIDAFMSVIPATMPSGVLFPVQMVARFPASDQFFKADEVKRVQQPLGHDGIFRALCFHCFRRC